MLADIDPGCRGVGSPTARLPQRWSGKKALRVVRGVLRLHGYRGKRARALESLLAGSVYEDRRRR